MYKRLNLKRIMIFILSLCLMLTAVMAVGCNKENPTSSGNGDNTPVYVISAYKKTIAIDEEYQLYVVDLPSGTSVKWSVNDKRIASVTENGLVKGIKQGSTKVIARVGEQVLECEIIVKVELESYLEIVFPAEIDNQITLSVGDTYTFAPQLSNGDQTAQFTITSSSIMIGVQGLTITAISAVNNATVTVSCNQAGVAPVTFTVTVI